MAEGPEKTPDWVLRSRDRWRSRFFVSWGAIGILALISVLGFLIWRVRSAVAPFVVAAIITFLLKGPVAGLSNRTRLSRAQAILVIFLVLVIVLSALMTAVAPVLARQLASFATTVPRYLAEAEAAITSLQNQYSTRIQLPDWLQTLFNEVGKGVGTLFVGLANSAANVLLVAGGGVVTGAFDVLLGIVLSFWILKDLPGLVSALEELAGPRYSDDLAKLIETVNFTVGGYLRGQTICSALTAIFSGIGLAIVGVPYALLITVIAFFFTYVPYIGPFLVALIAAVIALFKGGWVLALVALAIVIAAQQVVDTFIGPRVMSEQVDLHPTLVIFSLLVGGTLFGIVGMLFAIPVAATAKGLFTYYWNRREHHPLSGPSPIIKPDMTDDTAGGT